MILYKKGYLIRVTSWENDADNYRTEEVHEVSKKKAKQVVEFAKLFESRSRGKGGIGNLGDDEGYVARVAFNKFYEKHPDFFVDEENPLPDKAKIDEDYLADVVGDWGFDIASDLGLGGSEYYCTRVCDSVKVFYFPEDVECEEIKW